MLHMHLHMHVHVHKYSVVETLERTTTAYRHAGSNGA